MPRGYSRSGNDRARCRPGRRLCGKAFYLSIAVPGVAIFLSICVHNVMVRLIWVLFWAASAWAQVTTGSIAGYVFDPAEAPIEHAEVTLSQPDRHWARTIFTDGEGHYSFAELPPATYSIVAKAPNMSPVRADLHPAVNTRLRADFHMLLAGTEIMFD